MKHSEAIKTKNRRFNELHVGETLWEHVQSCAEYVANNRPDRDFSPFGWAMKALLALEKLGYAVRHIDEDNNLVFEATPKLLAGRDGGDLVVFSDKPIAAETKPRSVQ